MVDNKQFEQVMQITKKNGLNGLKNIGNTCYMNSIIQILLKCNDIKEYFLNNKHIDIIIDNNKDKNLDEIFKEATKYLSFQFGKVIYNLWNGDKVFIPNEFKYIFGQKIELFQGSEQQDSLEALLCIIDTIHNEIATPIGIAFHEKIQENLVLEKNYDGKDKYIKSMRSMMNEIKKCSIFKEIFLGLQHSKINCTECSNCSHTFDPILTFTLSFPENKPIMPQRNESININSMRDIPPFLPQFHQPPTIEQTIENIVKELENNPKEIDLNKIKQTEEKTILKWFDNFNKTNKSKYNLDSSSSSDSDFISYDDLNDYDANFLDSDDEAGKNKALYQAIKKITEKNVTSINIVEIKEELTLKKLLELQSIPELLNEKNQWFCDGCNKKVDAYKTMNFWYLPEVIVIHLKRFKKTYTSVQKITDNVIFPIDELNLDEYLDDESPMKNKNLKYELFGVNNHQSFGFTVPQHFLDKMNPEEQLRVRMMVSSGIDFGHYYSYCKNEDGKWYEFNDEVVREIKMSDIITDKAYLLFYRLKK
jgi:ubiquitin C-terminal hydrolase